MRRGALGIALFAVAALCAVAPQSESAKRAGVTIRVGDPYPGAALDFQEEPAVSLVPATKVYYVRDRECDLYRYGLYWYFLEDSLWFRARSWQGPFLHLQSTSVPRSVRTVPLNYRRHWPGPQPRALVQGDYKKQSAKAK
ncbi:MAG TPA: hypothetical protein VIX13_02045 [Candidatus Eisenbacteria bacterium]